MASRIYLKYKVPGTDIVEYYELSATERVENSLKGSPTRHRVEGGATVADHYNRDNEVVRLGGVLSNITRFSLNPVPTSDYLNNVKSTAEDYVSGIKKAWKRGHTLSVIYGASGESISNCVITSADFKRTNRTGDSYEVSLVLEQIKFSGKISEVDTGANRSFASFISTEGLPGASITSTVPDSDKFVSRTRTRELSVADVDIKPPSDLVAPSEQVLIAFEELVDSQINQDVNRESAEQIILNSGVFSDYEKEIILGQQDRVDYTNNRVFRDNLQTDGVTAQSKYWINQGNDTP